MLSAARPCQGHNAPGDSRLVTQRDQIPGGTPAFDELYDCARKLGSCEVVIECVSRPDGPALEVVVRRLADGAVAQRAAAVPSIEAAAARICAGLRRSLAG